MVNLFCATCDTELAHDRPWIGCDWTSNNYAVQRCPVCEQARDAKEAALCEKIARLENDRAAQEDLERLLK